MMHVTHITFTLWIRIRLSCLRFRQVEKNAFLWLHVLSTICGQKEVLSLGNLRMVSLHKKLNPNKQIDLLHVGLEIFSIFKFW
jgi:hypothetical protein